MFQLRRSVVQILSRPPTSLVSKPRSITNLSRLTFGKPYHPSIISYQRRWVSDESDNKDAPPVEKVAPAPEDEVEDAIQTKSYSEEVVKETNYAPEEQKSSIDTAIDKVTQVAAEAAQTVTGSASIAEDISAAATPKSQEMRETSRDPSSIPPVSSIYIGNLFFDVTLEDLRREFSRFGQIIDTSIIRDARGLSKGFGFIQFTTVEAATAAMETMGGSVFEGRRINIQYAARNVPKPSRFTGKTLNAPSKTLYIGNISFDMTDRDLNDLFKGLKNIIDVRVAIDRQTGQPKGFAHADFIDIQSAMDAFAILNEKESHGRPLRLDYSHPYKRSMAGSGGSQYRSPQSPS